MKKRAPRSVLELAVARVGLRRGMRVIAFVTAWGVARDALGHSPGDGQGASAAVQEYAKWWKQPLRTAWDEWTLFHEAFPSESTPDRLLDLMRADRADVGSLPADSVA